MTEACWRASEVMAREARFHHLAARQNRQILFGNGDSLELAMKRARRHDGMRMQHHGDPVLHHGNIASSPHRPQRREQMLA